MSIFSEINPFIQYFTQLRKLENYLVFDVAFPQTWKIQKRYVSEDKFMNNGVHDGALHLSFVCEYDEENINLIQNNILGIIQFNLEREEKERLLDSKIQELKVLFEKESLDSLKVLKFDLDEPVIKTKSDVKTTKRKSDGISEIIAEEG